MPKIANTDGVYACVFLLILSAIKFIYYYIFCEWSLRYKNLTATSRMFEEFASTHFEWSHCGAAKIKIRKRKWTNKWTNKKIQKQTKISWKIHTKKKTRVARVLIHSSARLLRPNNKRQQRRRARMNRIKQNGINLSRAEAKQTIFFLYLCRLHRSKCSPEWLCRRHVYVYKCAMFVVCAWLFVNATDCVFTSARQIGSFGIQFYVLWVFVLNCWCSANNSERYEKHVGEPSQQRQRWKIKKKPNKMKLPLAMTITLKHFSVLFTFLAKNRLNMRALHTVDQILKRI